MLYIYMCVYIHISFSLSLYLTLSLSLSPSPSGHSVCQLGVLIKRVAWHLCMTWEYQRFSIGSTTPFQHFFHGRAPCWKNQVYFSNTYGGVVHFIYLLAFKYGVLG